MEDKKDSRTPIRKVGDIISDVVNGRVDLSCLSMSNARYPLFVAGLTFIYINFQLEAEKNLRRLSDLNKEIKELRYESITTSAELMNMSKQSEVLRRVEAEGLDLKELTEPPRLLEDRSVW